MIRAVRLTRANGLNERWTGDAGAIRFLEEDDAADIVSRLLAVYAPEHDPVTFVGPEAAAARIESLTTSPEPVADEGELPDPENPITGRTPGAADIDSAPELKRPYGNHSKAAWVEWAVHQGADAQEAAALTKNELMSRYGERL